MPNKALQWFGNAWVELFRNIPILVQLFLWYHVVPKLFPVMKTAVPGFLEGTDVGEASVMRD